MGSGVVESTPIVVGIVSIVLGSGPSVVVWSVVVSSSVVVGPAVVVGSSVVVGPAVVVISSIMGVVTFVVGFSVEVRNSWFWIFRGFISSISYTVVPRPTLSLCPQFT